jgi:hypothetical protein
LKLSGYLCGTDLSVNDLVYLPQLGTFQLEKLEQHRFERGVKSLSFVFPLINEFSKLVEWKIKTNNGIDLLSTSSISKIIRN